MKATWKSVISLLLVFVFVFQLMPLPSFATEVDYTNSTEEIDASEAINKEKELTEASAVDSYIVGEDEELRDESVKHFRMNDGTIMAVEYGVPVHYQKADGKWENIDNTLQKVGEDYISVNLS